MQRFSSLVTNRAGWVLVGIVAITAFFASRVIEFGTGTVRLQLDPSLNRLLPEADEERTYYDWVRRVFGSDETLLLALVDDDVFSRDNLARVLRITERIEKLDGVHHVVSLATALNIRAENGDLDIASFLTDVPETPAEIERIRREALDNPIYAGNLVSRDGRATALLVYLREMSEQDFVRVGLDHQIAAIAEAERGTARVWMTGPPYVKAATSRALLADLMRIVPLCLLLASAVALVAFRSLRGVAIPLTTVLIALVWTLGALAWAGRSLNLVTTILPPLVLTIGFAYVVHVLAEYYHHARIAPSREVSGREAARRALADVALPILLTALTTGAGFVALTVSRLGAIREFGLFALVSVGATAAAALLFAPAVLALLPPPRRFATRGPSRGSEAFDRLAEALARFDLRHRRAIFVAASIVIALSVIGMTRVRVSADLIANFRPESTVRQHFEAINEALEGSNPFYIVVETDYRDAFKEPVNIRELEALQAWLEAQPEIGGTTSLVDYLKVINRGFHDGDPAYLTIPESRALTTQLLMLGGSDELESFVDSRSQITSILVRSKVLDSGAVAELIRRIEGRLTELPDHLRATVTGNTVLVTSTVDEISRGQAKSLTIAFVSIYLILAMLFTSFWVGFVALIPNALPVAVYFGALGLSGLSLNTTTGLVACIVLGIAVDDTIHYLSRFAAGARRLADEREGTIAALRAVARPVTATTATLVLGFLTLLTSDLLNQAHFGALAAFTLAFAWLIDVTLTPALCSRLRIVSLWDVLTLDLGADPHRSIPLFRGLTKHQAKVVALTTDLRQFPKGEALMRIGEPGDEMYVVIDGELRCCVATPERTLELETLQRGGVVGEVALFYGKRTADVDALTDVRLLRLTRENLKRLRRRHPRIGAHLLGNLSEILSGRLAKTTGWLR